MEIDLIGSVNEKNVLALRNCIFNNNEQINELKINISSSNGSVLSGITMYNLLKNLPIKIHTHNIGDVSSAGMLIYLAGNIRTAEEQSKFTIKPITINPATELSYYKIQELLHNIEMDIINYSSIVNERTDNLKCKYNIQQYLQGNNLILDKREAYICGILTNF